MITCASRRDWNHSRLRHSSRNRPLNDSLVPFCQGLPWIDDGSLDVRVGQPLQDRATYKFWTTVRTQERRGTALAHQSRQDFDDPLGANAAGYVDGEAFVREFV